MKNIRIETGRFIEFNFRSNIHSGIGSNIVYNIINKMDDGISGPIFFNLAAEIKAKTIEIHNIK